MKYECIVEAKFISRPNRFIAHVDIDGTEVVVHVKNTGRCKELLIPGCRVYLEKATNPERKTPYDLVAVDTPIGIINIDSQAPNAVVKEWLLKQDYDLVVPEYKYGNSRIDFYMEKGEDKYLLEVKGCTLIKDGIGYFPDAPTERGVKHLRELTAAIDKGYKAMAAFVIQVEGVTEVRPNIETHPEFGVALKEAEEAGVEVLFLECNVKKDELTVKASKSL
ncbi:MAG: DNA/RNA nuclease SfsA [Pseudobutyrivibrio sp.]|nr:DNA/RNA nuclease SfsA [Pseudobutyrivibrio sp.]